MVSTSSIARGVNFGRALHFATQWTWIRTSRVGSKVACLSTWSAMQVRSPFARRPLRLRVETVLTSRKEVLRSYATNAMYRIDPLGLRACAHTTHAACPGHHEHPMVLHAQALATYAIRCRFVCRVHAFARWFSSFLPRSYSSHRTRFQRAADGLPFGRVPRLVRRKWDWSPRPEDPGTRDLVVYGSPGRGMAIHHTLVQLGIEPHHRW